MSGGRNESCDAGRSHNWLHGIGRGQFGVVLYGHNRQTQNKVALKIIHSTMGQESKDEDKELDKVGARARATLKKMRHPNIVTCIDLWCGHLSKMQLKDLGKLVGGSLPSNFQLPPTEQRIPVVFLELEFVPENLRHYLKTTSDEWAGRFEIFKQIAVGLDYIHSQKMVHGRLSPENILLTANSNGGQQQEHQVKIGDHGLLQFFGSPKTTSPDQQDLSVLYQAPEIKTEPSGAAEPADVFSLGIILFELMHLPCNQQKCENEAEFWKNLQNSISQLTQERQFPPDFKSDQYTTKLVLDITDKDVTKRPAVLQITDLFDGSLRREVKTWDRWCIELEETFVKGDLIEFNHTPCSHWAMYLGDGKAVHFKPKSDDKGDVNYEKFSPAQVSISTLKDVAGVCLIRMNNRPEIRAKCRTPESTAGVIKSLAGRSNLIFSKAYLNAEHFITFLKFDGVSFSSQVMNNRKVFCLIRMHQRKNPKDFQVFNQLAYEQWLENCQNKDAANVLEKGIKEWANSV